MMKQFFILLFITFTYSAYSQIITADQAQLIASNFVFGEEQTIKSQLTYGNDSSAQLYIVNFDPEGWAIVSSNKETRPVIGYSPTGYFDAELLNFNAKDWLDNQVMQIKNRDTSKGWSDEWETLEKGKLPITKSASAVEPILATKWNQGSGWNKLCPSYDEGPDGKAYIGCVAVAMAQALYNIKYPERPVGTKSYALEPYGTISTNFDNEPEYKWNSMALTTPDDYNCQLLYNCAVAVEMDFGGSGSGAYTTRVPFAFRNYFQFYDAVKCIVRTDYSTESEWVSILKDQLNAGNVLVYSGDPGTGEAGHAFNIDGYAASGYFHFNWGWSGSYNGYFSINNVAPGSNDFNSSQKAVINIAVPYWGPTDIELSNKTVDAGQPIGTLVGDITVTDNSDEDTFTFEVKGAPLFLEDGYADAKFYIENMQLKTNEVLVKTSYPLTATIFVTDSELNTYQESFDITVTGGTSVLSEKQLDEPYCYPNPAHDIIKLVNSDAIESFKLIDITGKIIMWQTQITDDYITVSQLKSGTYFIQLSLTNGNTTVEKIIIE
jgi:hypothetical protein